MAEVSYLHHAETVDDFDFEQDEIFAFDSVYPYCSHVFCTDSDSISLNDHNIHHSGDFITEPYDQIEGISFRASGSDSFEEILDRENQVTYAMDLIQQRVEQSLSVEIESSRIERNTEEIGANSLQLELGGLLGLDTEYDGTKELGYGDEEDDDNFGGFIVSDCGHEFYVSRRGSGNNPGGSSSGGQGGLEINRFSGGLNVVSFESDSEDEVGHLLESGLHLDDDYASASRNDDENFTLCWNSLNLEDHRDGNDDFEWEEVHNGLELLDPDESLSVLPIVHPEEDETEETGRSRNVEWEVLLNVNNLERHPMTEINEGLYLGEEDGFIYTANDEVTFAQFAEAEDASMDRPPASSLVIENLPLVIIEESDIQNGNALCAVCKDEMGVGEQVKQLPCSHRYHGDCITPWLEISNTCPVCRHELPTDDPDYEQRQMERAARDQSRVD